MVGRHPSALRHPAEVRVCRNFLHFSLSGERSRSTTTNQWLRDETPQRTAGNTPPHTVAVVAVKALAVVGGGPSSLRHLVKTFYLGYHT